MMNPFEPQLKVVEVNSSVGRWIKITKNIDDINTVNQGISYLNSISHNSINTEDINGNNKSVNNCSLKKDQENLYIGCLGSVSTIEPHGLLETIYNSEFAAYGLIGVWRFDKNITKCLFVTRSEFIAEIGHNERIYKILEVKFVLIEPNRDKLPKYIKIRDSNDLENEDYNGSDIEDKLESAKLAEEMIISIFNRGGFYFSTCSNMDITKSIRQSIIYGNRSGDLPEERFCWNYNFLLPLYEGGSTTSKWASPIISGFVGYSRFTFNKLEDNIENESSNLEDEMEINFLLVSRRDYRRQGVRYLSRGANMDGNASNSVETEQIIIVRKRDSIQLFSYLQFRGSIPIIWRQIPNMTKTPPFMIHDDKKNQQIVLNRHFNELSRKYCNQIDNEYNFNIDLQDNDNVSGKIIVANLIDYKLHELRLGLEFENYLNNIDINNIYLEKNESSEQDASIIDTSNKNIKNNTKIKFCWFDFHKECSEMRWSNLRYLVNNLVNLGLDEIGITSLIIKLKDKTTYSPILGIVQGHYSSTDDEFKVIVNSIQNGICRTNCIDCLDRTNVVQSVLGRRILHLILRQINNIDLKQSLNYSQSDLGPAFEPLPGKDDNNELSFRRIWTDNADALSKLYSGTPAQKTDFTRYGKRTQIGILKDSIYSILRFLLNSLVDGYNQDAYYVFRNQCSSPNSDLGIKKNIHEKLLLNRHPYLSLPILYAIGQYFTLIAILLFLPFVQYFILYLQIFGGNMICLLFDIIFIPSKLIFQMYGNESSDTQESILNLFPSISSYLSQPNQCFVYSIAGNILTIFILIIGLMRFIKFRGSKVATKPLIDDSNSNIWNDKKFKEN